MASPLYRRALVKISGEALMGEQSFGLHQPTVERIASDLASAHSAGIQLAVVVGGGNIFRGVEVSQRGVDRPTGDAMGMLATVMNALAIGAAIEHAGISARVLSGVAMPTICETYTRQKTRDHLDHGRIVVLGGGIGHPYFTTDTTAALRAAETQCDVVLKATNVDGIYTADPKRDPLARRYAHLTYNQALEQRIGVMDAAAFALARDASLPIIVFSIQQPGSISAVLRGEPIGTLVSAQERNELNP